MNLLDSINSKICNELRMDPVKNLSDSLFSIYPYNVILDAFRESLILFSTDQQWINCLKELDLTYSKMKDNYFYLDEFDSTEIGIPFNRIKRISYIKNTNQKVILSEYSYINYLEKVANYGITLSEPKIFAIRNNKCYIWPKPDKDYSLKIEYYAYIPHVISENEAILYFENDAISETIFNYINYIILAFLQKENADDYLLKYQRGKINSVNLTTNSLKPYLLSSRIQW